MKKLWVLIFIMIFFVVNFLKLHKMDAAYVADSNCCIKLSDDVPNAGRCVVSGAICLIDGSTVGKCVEDSKTLKCYCQGPSPTPTPSPDPCAPTTGGKCVNPGASCVDKNGMKGTCTDDYAPAIPCTCAGIY